MLGNHDEPRLASRIGPSRLKLAAVLLLTLRGTPTLYYGDELGLESLRLGPSQVRDPLGRRVAGQGRDAGRGPMPWTEDRGAGFCASGVDPWLPVPPDYRRLSVARQRRDRSALLHVYRRLLRLRRAYPALTQGDIAEVSSADGVLSYERATRWQRVRVLLNLSASDVEVQKEDAVLFSTSAGKRLLPGDAAILMVHS